jgi:hypothetical protein
LFTSLSRSPLSFLFSLRKTEIFHSPNLPKNPTFQGEIRFMI